MEMEIGSEAEQDILPYIYFNYTHTLESCWFGVSFSHVPANNAKPRGVALGMMKSLASHYSLSLSRLASLILLQTCGKQVTLDQPRLQHENLIWHGTDECFVCAFCSLSLLGQPYLPRHGKVFCSKDHAKQFRSKSKK